MKVSFPAYSLYKTANTKVSHLENVVIQLVEELNPHMLTTPSINPITATVIVSEYGNLNRFTSASQMLPCAGLEVGYYKSEILEFRKKIVKHVSSQSYYILMNCIVALIHFHTTRKLVRAINTSESKGIDYNASKLR